MKSVVRDRPRHRRVTCLRHDRLVKYAMRRGEGSLFFGFQLSRAAGVAVELAEEGVENVGYGVASGGDFQSRPSRATRLCRQADVALRRHGYEFAHLYLYAVDAPSPRVDRGRLARLGLCSVLDTVDFFFACSDGASTGRLCTVQVSRCTRVADTATTVFPTHATVRAGPVSLMFHKEVCPVPR